MLSLLKLFIKNINLAECGSAIYAEPIYKEGMRDIVSN